VHWLLLAAVASQRCCGRILEIGTFDGETTALMARLFPASRIVTLDLPPDDPILGATYGRSGPAKRGAFERRLAANTAVDRIALLRVNSFFLPSVVAEQFDLIWLDGGHLYPEIAWDFCNAWHLLREGGILMCDDVVPDPKGIRDGYVSPDSYQVLEYVARRTDAPWWLFLKRESAEWSADPRERKFVALLCKPAGLPAKPPKAPPTGPSNAL